MEFESLCSSRAALEKMVCTVVVGSALAAQESLLWLFFMGKVTRFHQYPWRTKFELALLFQSAPPGTTAFQGLVASERRYPVGDLERVLGTMAKTRDASELEDDDDEEEDEDSSDDEHDEDDDYSGEGSNDDQDDSDEVEGSGNGGSDEDDEDGHDDDDEDQEDDDDDDDDDDQEDDNEEDEEDKHPAKKKK